MMEEICEELPPNKACFTESGFLNSHEGSDKQCVLHNDHDGPHLTFLELDGKYIIWEKIDEASGMRDICEECPWAGKDGCYEECTCVYYDIISLTKGKRFAKQGFVDADVKTKLQDR